MNDRSRRIAVLGLISPHPGRNRGGTAISVARLANHLAAHDRVEVDLLVSEQALSAEFRARIDPRVTIRSLGSRRRLGILIALLNYLREVHQAAVIAFDTRANVLAVRLKQLAGSRVAVWPTLRATVAGKALPGSRRSRRVQRMYRSMYERADGVIAISNGLAREFAEFTGVDEKRIHVIPELVVGPETQTLAAEPVNHRWLRNDGGQNSVPVVLTAGRLEPGKDFPTLLHAVAELRRTRPLRLIILGRGTEREALTVLASELGIEADVDFPGFRDNPLAFMARADVFVLSSRSEGFGMVLAEALSVGCPVVSTDCPSGPREILDHGRYGSLVPVGDPAALARAIEATLAEAPSPETLRTAAKRYSVRDNGDAYLALIESRMS